MSIRPVDLQVMVQKSTEVTKINNNERQHSNAQGFTEIMKKEVAVNDQQITHSNKTEHDGIDKNGKGNNSYNSKNKKRNKDSKKEEEPKKKSLSMFDMTI